MLTVEEEQQKKEIIDLTEEVLEAKGIECDSRIAKLSEEKLREILEEVRKLRRKRKRLSPDGTDNRIREAYTVPVRTISIFFVIGIPLILLWLYVDENSRQQKKMATLFAQPCICSICKHDRAGICLKQKCACCIVMKGTNAVGHSINSINDRRDGTTDK